MKVRGRLISPILILPTLILPIKDKFVISPTQYITTENAQKLQKSQST